MSYKPMFFSSFYAMTQLGLGLLLHPYQTMQSIVQEKFFVWMTVLPSVTLAVITVLWRFGIVPFVRLLFTCKTQPLLPCSLLPFISDWLTFFCVYWQVLLLYLLFRFSVAFGKSLQKYDIE